MKKVSTLVKEMEKKFNGISGIKDMYAWDGGYEPNQAIHLGDAVEGGWVKEKIDKETAEIIGDGPDWVKSPAAMYYGEFGFSDMYVNPKLEGYLNKNGFSIEWYDSGTLYAYRD